MFGLFKFGMFVLFIIVIFLLKKEGFIWFKNFWLLCEWNVINFFFLVVILGKEWLIIGFCVSKCNNFLFIFVSLYKKTL